MALEKVKKYFEQYDLQDSILEFTESSATVELAAKAVGTEGARIAKSLSFNAGEGAIIIVCAGDAKIDNKKFRAEFNCKAKMIPRDRVETLIGHDVGGVCPFAVKEGVKVYLDDSLKRFETVFPACGSANSAIELTIDVLEKVSHSQKWVDVCKY